jgi:hypothetical protein
MGATYTILKADLSMLPSSRLHHQVTIPQHMSGKAVMGQNWTGAGRYLRSRACNLSPHNPPPSPAHLPLAPPQNWADDGIYIRNSCATHICSPMVCMMQSMATLVLPAPVGAHTSMFSAEYRAAGHTRDCTHTAGNQAQSSQQATKLTTELRTNQAHAQEASA